MHVKRKMPEAPSDPKRLVFQIVIQGALEDVWNEITRTDAPIAAFFNNQMHVTELKAGARLAMRTGNAKYTGVVGKILECEKPHRFVHTFRFTAYGDPECVVAYELKEVVGGVEFTLTVTDVPEGTKTAKNMAQGGTMIVNTLKRVIETGKPSFGIRMLYGLFKVMEPFSPKQCRSEHWPLEEEAPS